MLLEKKFDSVVKYNKRDMNAKSSLKHRLAKLFRFTIISVSH